MEILKIIILFFYLAGVAFLAGFSWLYLTRTVRAINEIGLQAPQYINVMIKLTIAVALATAVLIGIFLLTSFY